MKNNISDYQIIGGVIAYIIVMIISWLKKLPTNAPNAIFTAIVFSGMIYKIFIKKEKNNMFFNILTMIGSFIFLILIFFENVYEKKLKKYDSMEFIFGKGLRPLGFTSLYLCPICGIIGSIFSVKNKNYVFLFLNILLIFTFFFTNIIGYMVY